MPHALYSSVYAGSPLPVDGGQVFDLAAHLVKHPDSTFFVRVSGDSMIEAGISDGDILIIDTSLDPRPSDVVVAKIDDGFTVKRFSKEQGRLHLVPDNPSCNPPALSEDAHICGVALFSIHQL